MPFPLPLLQRRGISSTRVISTDENSGPGMDQSGLMAGKSNVQTRRSVLGSVNTNTVTNTNEVKRKRSIMLY